MWPAGSSNWTTARAFPFEGNYSAWLEAKEARMALDERRNVSRKKSLKTELEWIRMAPKARQSKGKARLANYDKLVKEAKEQTLRDEKLEIEIPANKRLGDIVIEAKDLSKGFGDKLLIDDLTFTLPPAGIVGIIGANGAGKTTLFRMITGTESTDEGALRVGETVQLGYVDQSRDALDADRTVYAEICDGQDVIELGGRRDQRSGLCGVVQLQGSRPAEACRPTLWRRTQPRPPGQGAA